MKTPRTWGRARCPQGEGCIWQGEEGIFGDISRGCRKLNGGSPGFGQHGLALHSSCVMSGEDRSCPKVLPGARSGSSKDAYPQRASAVVPILERGTLEHLPSPHKDGVQIPRPCLGCCACGLGLDTGVEMFLSSQGLR